MTDWLSVAASPSSLSLCCPSVRVAVDVVPAVRSDRSLLLSSGSSSGALSLGKKLHGGAAGGVEDVDTSTRVRPALAFQHFAGALYTGEGARQNGTFETGPSALLVAGAAGSGSQAPSSVGAGAAADAQAVRLKFENPFIKLQRLQDEIKEFDVELREAVAQQPKGGAPDAAQDLWATLSTSVHQLQGQLDAMLDQPQVKQMLAQEGGQAAGMAAAASASLLPQFDSLFETYVAELTANPSFQPYPASAAAHSDVAAPAAVSTSSELAALPKLDERLHALEKLLGMSAGAKQPAMPQLSFNAPTAAANGTLSAPSTTVLPAPDLVSALSSLHAQLVQLNPQRLEFVSRSCKQILIEQESIALSAKQAKEDAATGAKVASSPSGGGDKKDEAAEAAAATAARPYAAQVSHLYSLTSRWDTLALTLPTLIARLSSLHALHASSATLAGRVADLERQSGAIDAALAAQRDGVQAVAKSAAENLAAIHANFKAMDNKIQQLNKKMEQISK